MSDPVSAGARLEQWSEEIAGLVARVLPCSVAISGMTRDFSEVAGSGFLLDDAGHLVTSGHVVEGLEPPLWVGLVGCPHVAASVVGVDRLTDLAVLHLKDYPPRHLPLRERAARLGEVCLAFGSPFGKYRESVSLGIVSGLGRNVPQEGRRPIENAIQTDAAVNPGNSGGPLVDVRGHVLGINMCVDPRAQDISFAVPADTIRYVSAELIAYGRVERAALGVAVAARVVELAGGAEHRLAVAAARTTVAGDLRPGDVLLRIGGREVRNHGDLFRLLNRECIGRPTEVQLLRDGRPLTVTVMPGRLSETEALCRIARE